MWLLEISDNQLAYITKIIQKHFIIYASSMAQLLMVHAWHVRHDKPKVSLGKALGTAAAELVAVWMPFLSPIQQISVKHLNSKHAYIYRYWNDNKNTITRIDKGQLLERTQPILLYLQLQKNEYWYSRQMCVFSKTRTLCGFIHTLYGVTTAYRADTQCTMQSPTLNGCKTAFIYVIPSSVCLCVAGAELARTAATSSFDLVMSDIFTHGDVYLFSVVKFSLVWNLQYVAITHVMIVFSAEYKFRPIATIYI